MSGEIPIEQLPLIGQLFAHLAGKGIRVQFFERGVVIYDPAHLVDNPPGAGPVYLLHLYNGGPGTDPRIAQLQAALATAQQAGNLASADAGAAAKLAQIKALVG